MDSGQLQAITAMALLFGWILAWIPLRARTAGLVATATGLGGVAMTIGRLGAPLGQWIHGAVDWVWRARHWPFTYLPDPAPALLAFNELTNAAAIVLARLLA